LVTSVKTTSAPFEVHVQEGQVVDENTLLVIADFDKIRHAGKAEVVLTTNMNQDFTT
jgi:phosphotransferase system IIA component